MCNCACAQFLLGRYLRPIHDGVITNESAADTVFYSDTFHPENNRSTTELLSLYDKNGSISLANNDSSDSGIISSDQESGSVSTNYEMMERPIFNVTFLSEESTEC